jgi:uncharacterized membrane protein
MKRNFATRAPWFLMLFLATGITGYALAFLLVDPLGPPGFKEHFQTIFLAPTLHILTGAVALFIGPFQLLPWLRRRKPQVHRTMGRIYLIAVSLSALGGLVLAIRSIYGPAAQLGFGTLAVLWLFTAFKAYTAIRAGNVPAHQAWMLRNFSLTFAAVMLRLYMPLAMVLGAPLQVAYPAIAWLCWVPNLLLVQYLLVNKSDWLAQLRADEPSRLGAPNMVVPAAGQFEA